MAKDSGAPATVGDMESLLGDTIMQVSTIEKNLAQIAQTQHLMAEAHGTIAEAIKSMADTFKRAEERQDKLETTNQNLYKEKGVSPNVFFLVTGTLCGVIILGAVWVTDTSIRATLTSFEAGKTQAKELSEVKKEIINEARDGK